jgi:hypothetical protein
MKTYQRIQAGKDHGQPQPTRREIQQRGSAAKARKANQTPARSLKAPKDKHQPQTAATTKKQTSTTTAARNRDCPRKASRSSTTTNGAPKDKRQQQRQHQGTMANHSHQEEEK